MLSSFINYEICTREDIDIWKQCVVFELHIMPQLNYIIYRY